MRRGLSLIEVIVAMAILSLVMLAVLALAATSRRTTINAETAYQAAVLAQSLLEREKGKDFGELTPGGPTALSVDDLSGPPRARAERTIEDVPGFDGRLKTITVKVHWSEAGVPRTEQWSVRVSDLPR